MNIEVETINGIQTETVYDIDSFPYYEFITVETCRKRKISYLNIEAAFDIETTNVKAPEPFSFMYHWQFCLRDRVIFGRTWNDFLSFMTMLKDRLQLTSNRMLVIYVHNLSFEFQFLKNMLDFTSVFAREPRKPIKAQCEGFEFRCSYYLSNMSLSKFCENTKNVIHYKLTDTYDYNKLRTAETELTDQEKAYCYNDVRGLCECIHERLKEDTITSIPLTSTGYVRRNYRKAVKKNRANRRIFTNQRLTAEQYQLMKEAFRGGNTHANAYFSGQMLEDIDSFDISSSYPAALEIDRYPVGAFISASPSYLNKILSDPAACFIARFRFENIRTRQNYGMPYIDMAHCRGLKNAVNDNGRILEAEALEITLTDIDLKIIMRTYKYETMYCRDLNVARYGYLSKELREELLYYFRLKSELKGIEGKEYEYMKSKNAVNSTYGMMVTDITQDEVLFQDGIWSTEKPDVEEALETYYKSWNSFLSYQHGVWCTANARKRLQDMLDIIKTDVVYIDTDSIKCFKGHKEDFDRMNEQIRQKVASAPLPPEVEANGKIYTMGIWDYEGTYEKFITWGSKKYCVRKDGKIQVTVAGLSKRKGSQYLTEIGMDKFKLGLIFPEEYSGRLTAYYNDDAAHYIEINGCRMLSGSNVALIPTTYELGITDEYAEVLDHAGRMTFVEYLRERI